MTKQEVTYAQRQAAIILDNWLEETGVIEINSSYHSELKSIIEDAVHIGIQTALYGKINNTEAGEIEKLTYKP